MIVKIIDGNSISVKSEEPDDMVALRRAISVGDRIAGSTSRETHLRVITRALPERELDRHHL